MRQFTSYHSQTINWTYPPGGTVYFSVPTSCEAAKDRDFCEHMCFLCGFWTTTAEKTSRSGWKVHNCTSFVVKDYLAFCCRVVIGAEPTTTILIIYFDMLQFLHSLLESRRDALRREMKVDRLKLRLKCLACSYFSARVSFAVCMVMACVVLKNADAWLPDSKIYLLNEGLLCVLDQIVVSRGFFFLFFFFSNLLSGAQPAENFGG